MTMPSEAANAIIYAHQFLRDLIDPRKTPRVPKAIREQARSCLRHYPFDCDRDAILCGLQHHYKMVKIVEMFDSMDGDPTSDEALIAAAELAKKRKDDAAQAFSEEWEDCG